MKLTNEFTVAVPIERAWDALLDIERVAGFLPGAKVEASGEEGVYRGTMKVKVGPMVVNYRGTARLVRADESQHLADIAVDAKDTRGQGTASAVIHNRLVPQDDGTKVIAETDLNVTGRQAQFGRGIMQDIASRMLDDFAHRFERYLLEGEGAEAAPARTNGGRAPVEPGAPAPAEPGAPAPAETPEALDIGAAIARTAAVRRGVAVLAGVLLLLLLIRRRSR